MKPEVIRKLDIAIQHHNDGLSDHETARGFGCHISQLRSMFAILKKLGEPIVHGSSTESLNDAEKAALKEAVQKARIEARQKIIEARR